MFRGLTFGLAVAAFVLLNGSGITAQTQTCLQCLYNLRKTVECVVDRQTQCVCPAGTAQRNGLFWCHLVGNTTPVAVPTPRPWNQRVPNIQPAPSPVVPRPFPSTPVVRPAIPTAPVVPRPFPSTPVVARPVIPAAPVVPRPFPSTPVVPRPAIPSAPVVPRPFPSTPVVPRPAIPTAPVVPRPFPSTPVGPVTTPWAPPSTFQRSPTVPRQPPFSRPVAPTVPRVAAPTSMPQITFSWASSTSSNNSNNVSSGSIAESNRGKKGSSRSKEELETSGAARGLSCLASVLAIGIGAVACYVAL